MSEKESLSHAIEALIKARRFDEATSSAEAALQSQGLSETERKKILHLAGTAFYLMGQVGRSIESFKKVLAIDPKHTDSAISLSIVYNDIGKYEEAKKIYQVANQSLKLKSRGTDALLDRQFAIKHLEMGDLYFKFHRYDDALEDYSKALRLDPQQLDTRIKLAKVYAKKGFTTRAIQELQQLCYEHEDFLPARIQLGLMYYSLGNVIDAQLEWERVRAKAPANAEVRTYLDMAVRASETSI